MDATNFSGATLATAPETGKQSGTLAWQSAQSQLAAAVADLRYSTGLHRMLAQPRRELKVQIPLHLDDGTLAVLAGYRVQHNSSRGPSKGGLKHTPNVSLAEVKTLAMWMTRKCALLGVP